MDHVLQLDFDGLAQPFDDPFEKIHRAIEFRIVAQVLDDGAGMLDGGAVAAEQAANFGIFDPPDDVREVHRDLSRQGDARHTARGAIQNSSIDMINSANRCRNNLTKVGWPGSP